MEKFIRNFLNFKIEKKLFVVDKLIKVFVLKVQSELLFYQVPLKK